MPAAPPIQSAPPKRGLTQVERKKLVQERCARSVTWRVIHWLGSLQLALILLATIAIACAIATFAESGFSAKVAQAYIYKAPWFVVWLGVLCINLISVTITRWPWERKHVGFIVTHYGIVTLLLGAMVGLHTGFEGNVTLSMDSPPVKRVTTNRSIIQIQSPADTYLYLKPFDAELARLSPARPTRFAVPGTDLTIVAEEYSPSLVSTPQAVASPADTDGPVAVVRFASPVTDQEIPMPFSLSEGPQVEDFFGLASIEFAKELPPIADAGETETRMVFARFAPVSNSSAEAAATVVQLSADGETITITDTSGNGATYRRSDLVGNSVIEAGARVSVESYWPDFAMEAGSPVSASDQPNNPAILARIQPLPEGVSGQKPTLQLAPDPDADSGQPLKFRLLRGGLPVADGHLKPGEPLRLGWADWTATLVDFFEQGQIATRMEPGSPPPSQEEEPLPGFLAFLEGPNGAGPKRWIPSGEVTSLTDGRRVVRLGYGLETRPLPFSMRLLKFEVPRDEGTDQPADFRATVQFSDPQTGETKTGVARMNQPASFPGTLMANLTGINYKFSQAEWNPRDLEQTTLQVLYDPGWLLKWVGSLGICLGITLQFYFTPRARGNSQSTPRTRGK